MGGVKGNFGVMDGKEYFVHASNSENGIPTYAIHTSIEGIVLAQQNLFAWKGGVAAEARIKDRRRCFTK